MRVLLVENHADTRILLKSYLELKGHTVIVAETKAEALRIAMEGRWNVVISDIGLPDGNGWQLLEEAEFQEPVFAIAMSGYGSRKDVHRSTSAGFRRHILKPFELDELDGMLDEAEKEAGR